MKGIVLAYNSVSRHFSTIPAQNSKVEGSPDLHKATPEQNRPNTNSMRGIALGYHSVPRHFGTVPAQDSKVEAIPDQHEGDALGPDRLQQQAQAHPLQDEGGIPHNANNHTSLMAAQEPAVYLYSIVKVRQA